MRNNEIEYRNPEEERIRHNTYITYMAFMLTPELYSTLTESDKKYFETWMSQNGYVKDGVINPTQSDFREIRKRAEEIKEAYGAE